MIKLDNITLICIEGTTKEDNIRDSINALLFSSKLIDFAKILFLSPILYNSLPNKIIHVPIKTMTWIEYNSFIVNKLNNYIDTDFCITIQNDGFILNPNLWTNDFLNYDFIGHSFDFKRYPNQIAGVNPEIVIKKGIDGLNRVGNGGFSLRSKKLLELSEKITTKCNGPEDAFICNDNYDYFVSNDVKFAPVDVADKFSKDYSDYRNDTFGFHGNKNLIK